MTGADKVVCQAATLLLLFALTTMPAKAQFAGFGGGGGEDMMTQIAPMLEMMKAKMGKRRFAMMMQTMGPMMSRMMEGGGMGGMMGGGGFDGMAGGMPAGIGGMIPGGYAGMVPGDMGGFAGYGGDITGVMGGMGGGEMMSMIPQLMRMANLGGGRHVRRVKRK